MDKRIKTNLLSLFSACVLLSGCTSGGGNDNSGSGNVDSISNACSALGLNARIINGQQCVSEQSSPVVRILLNQTNGSQALCTGTMLTSRHVLTAAHCFTTAPRRAFVQIGGRELVVTSYIVHPDYRFDSTSFGVEAGYNDVAIMQLAVDARVPTLPLLISKDIDEGDSVAIYGFGLDENKNLGVLRGGTASLSAVTRDHITTNFDGASSDTCEGDSGGPAVVSVDGGLAIVGVTSSGTIAACTVGDVAIYSNTQSPDVINFIQDNAPGARIL